MTRSDSIRIGDRVYHRNWQVDRFQIPLEELGDLRMCDIPPHSHLEVLGIPMPPAEFEPEVRIVNGGDDADNEFISVYGGASIPVTYESAHLAVARLQRAFPGPPAYWAGNDIPRISVENWANRGLKANVYLGPTFKGRADTTVRAALEPFITGFRRLSMPDIHVFICHASEDKPIVRQLSDFISARGPAVWLDEREIMVGDSIVDKVGQGIADASHLVVVLSRHSVSKPWVAKELSSALMRQLRNQSVAVLPLRVDDADVPVLLADVRYADGRTDIQRGFQELLDAMVGADNTKGGA